MLDQVEKFVEKSFNRKSQHSIRTLYWIQKLSPECSEEMKIAAISHDIERAFNPKTKTMKAYRTGEALVRHQKEGGRIMRKFLIEQGYDEKKALRVMGLISKHEIGGDKEQNYLKDADSISWLEVSAPKHIKTKLFSEDELKKKIDYMFERITYKEAKKIARPFYEEAIKLLKSKKYNIKD